MPVNIPDTLPAKQVLQEEGIITISKSQAKHQDIRPLEIGILNLMPNKETTETQLLRLLSNTPLQVNIALSFPHGHTSKHCSAGHLGSFYKSSEEIRKQKYDGFIITGAPVEELNFSEVHYWKELQEVFEWTKTHVSSTLHICWGALAGAHYHYGIPKENFGEKLYGVFSHDIQDTKHPLLRGLDDSLIIPQSRYAGFKEKCISQNPSLTPLASSPHAGSSIITSPGCKEVFISGHLEYDRDSLKQEYERDIRFGKNSNIPQNYYPDNNPGKTPALTWRTGASQFFTNWLHFVYQSTPYKREEIGK